MKIRPILNYMLYSSLNNGELNKQDYIRYSRHILLPQIGYHGQKKLKTANVICIGIGGLGSTILMYLAAVGIGTIGIVDYDNVDLSNLPRQIIHSESFINKPKTDSAFKTLKRINPNCNIYKYKVKLNPANVLEILYSYDVIIDGTDDFETKYLINDACLFLNKPNVYGAISQFTGQVSVFNYRGGPTYRDVYPTMPSKDKIPSCSEAGVIAVLPGIIGMIQATETIKIILGIGEILSKKLLTYNALDIAFNILNIQSQINTSRKYSFFLQQSSTHYSEFFEIPKMTVTQLHQLIKFNSKSLLIIDVRTKPEHILNKIQNSISLPLAQLETQENIDWIVSQKKDKKIIVHCQANQRAKKAIQILNYYSIFAYQLDGGIISWNQNVRKSFLHMN